MFSIVKETFFNYARKAPLGGRLTQEQVDGIECILDACNHAGIDDLRKVAYILATAFHETGGKMIPVREGFAKSDAQARRIIANRRYGKPDATSNGKPLHEQYGHVYYGRGHVQLTWADNYMRMANILGVPLLKNPDLALDKDISSRILVEGMTRGLSGRGDFTGKSLDDYFSESIDDPIGARRIVNGTDKAGLIATYHKNFLDALNAAHTATPQPENIDPDLAKPDQPNLLKDKTIIGGAAGMASTGGLGFLASIDSPYALAALIVVALIAAFFGYMFLSGRFDIIRKAGA